MDKDKLNKKLAKWLGFYDDGFGLWYQSDATHGERRIGKLSGALNFTDSLDDCFKWLVPKLDGWSLSQKAQNKVVVAQVGLGNKGKAEGNNPASLALCLAIEKFIDGG